MKNRTLIISVIAAMLIGFLAIVSIDRVQCWGANLVIFAICFVWVVAFGFANYGIWEEMWKNERRRFRKNADKSA